MQAGIVPYAEAWYLQDQLRKARGSGLISDALLLLQHPPTITFGRGASGSNLLVGEDELKRLGIAMYVCDRGGDATYHGPGQIVGYPVLNLGEHHLSVARYLSRLEEVVLRTLADFGIEGSRRPGLIGVWIGARKVASLGIRVSRSITSHGFALNVNNDLLPFEYINPCGMAETRMTSVSMARNEAVALEMVEGSIRRHFQVVFDFGSCSLDRIGL